MRKLKLTYMIPDHCFAELSDSEIAQLFRDAVYEFASRSGKTIPARRDSVDYVEQRYSNCPSINKADKVKEVERRVNFAETIALIDVYSVECNDDE